MRCPAVFFGKTKTVMFQNLQNEIPACQKSQKYRHVIHEDNFQIVYLDICVIKTGHWTYFFKTSDFMLHTSNKQVLLKFIYFQILKMDPTRLLQTSRQKWLFPMNLVC
uniref:Uncharacterized protein n=1 Tax=Cacopsylla melanoneura TaxID=428564 RepID=A0A8D8ZWX9_9HEMI